MAKETQDYEKQFQEDLERAQALSLESLALEQFKNKKKIREFQSSCFSSGKKEKLTILCATLLC